MRVPTGQFRRLVISVALLVVLFAFGFGWYTGVERFTLLDAFYQVAITLTTVGFREVQPLDTSGKVFTSFFVLGGVGVMFYAATNVLETVVVGGMADALGERRMSRRVAKVQDHVVVCGFGRVGREVAAVLRQRGATVVIVDIDDERLSAARALGCDTVLGDATEEQILVEAGVTRARTLIAAADSDANNTFITMTAKALNPRVTVIARAASEAAQSRLRTAGADRVILPYLLAGRRMAVAAMQPMIAEFIDVLADMTPGAPILAEIVVADGVAGLAGLPLSGLFVRTTSLRVLALQHTNGELVVGPGGDTQLQAHDRLMLYGTQAEIEAVLSGAPHVRA